MKTQSIAVEKIKLSKQYEGAPYRKEAIATLASSIKKCGLLHPVTLHKQKNNGYVLLAGGRRLNAYMKLGKATIPARIVDKESMDICLAEDLEIKKRDYIQIAKNIKICIESGQSSFKELSKSIGKTVEWIKETIKIEAIPKAVQKKLKDNNLVLTRAQLLRIEGIKKQTDQIEAVGKFKLRELSGKSSKNLGGHSRLNSKYMTVGQLVEAQDMFSNGSLRSHLFSRETNGMVASGVIKMIGTRILINVKAFWKWVENRQNCKAA